MASSSGKRCTWDKDQHAGRKDKEKNDNKRKSGKYDDNYDDKTTEGDLVKYKGESSETAFLKYRKEKAGVLDRQGSC